MEKDSKRKTFCYLTTKVYGGKPGQKTVAIHFRPDEHDEAVKLARGILQAVEYGKDVDITLFTYKSLSDGTTRITVTSAT